MDVYSVITGKKCTYTHTHTHTYTYIYIYINPAVVPFKVSSSRYPSGVLHSFLVVNEDDEYILGSKMTVTSSCQGNTQNSINRCHLQENSLTH